MPNLKYDYLRSSRGLWSGAALACATYASALAAELPIRGVVEPVRQAKIATDLPAPVKTINGREGASFKTGDLLIAFDCRRYEAELKGSLADLDARQITQKSNETLLARNAIAKHEVLLSKAEVTKATATVEQLRTRLDQCEIRAPFDGKVAEVLVHEFEFPKTGAPLMKVISHADLEIRIIVPSDWLSWLKVGDSFLFSVDETGETVTGKVVRRAASVDAISQTITVFGVLVGPSTSIIPGMSGSAVFSTKKAVANGTN